MKRASLPYPPEVEFEALTALESNNGSDARHLISGFVRQQEDLIRQAELLEARATRLAAESICGLTDDSQDVELYDGSLGVTVEFVRSFSPPVGQLQWLDNLKSLFTGPNNSPGNVSGVRWGSGGLIGPDLFITAGHCFERTGGGWERPKRNGTTISEAEIAKLMKVNFNFQLDGQTKKLRDQDSYPVADLHEFRLGNLDYAIVQLGKNAAGKRPGDKFGQLLAAGDDLITNGAGLCLIQHPNGKPKMVEAGPLLSNSNSRVSYEGIDTLGGSSGAPVLNGETGEIVGVHTNGGCSAFSGANYGVAIGAIRKFSSIL